MPRGDLERLKGYLNEPTTMLKILDVLEKAGRPLWSGTICARAGVKPKIGNKVLVRLVDRGMVIRKRHPRKTTGKIPKPGICKKCFLYLLKEEYLPCRKK